MKRTIAAAFVVAVAMFALVTAQTGTQTQQQQTKTNTNTNTSTSTSTTNNAAPVDPLEPIVEPTVEPWVDPVVMEEEAAAATPRTGEKEAKIVATSCPIHPEVKTRAAGKCPVCRLEERKQTAVLEKEQGRPLPQPEPTPAPPPVSPPVSPTPLVSPTVEPQTRDMTQETDSTQPIP